jgi:hypothetical protein
LTRVLRDLTALTGQVLVALALSDLADKIDQPSSYNLLPVLLCMESIPHFRHLFQAKLRINTERSGLVSTVKELHIHFTHRGFLYPDRLELGVRH